MRKIKECNFFYSNKSFPFELIFDFEYEWTIVSMKIKIEHLQSKNCIMDAFFNEWESFSKFPNYYMNKYNLIIE